MIPLLLAMLLLAVPAVEAADDGSQPSFFSNSDSVTVIHPAPNVDYWYDQRGNSATILQEGPGLSRYSQQDRYGNITTQGYLLNPFPRHAPLDVPRSAPSSSDPFDYRHGKTTR